MKQFLPILICSIIFSCTKTDKPQEPFVGYVQIDSANTIKTVPLGQNITSILKLAIPSLGSDITFLGFEISETPTRVFSIKAKALYKPWANQVSLPVYQTVDKTITINTLSTGIHILNFYNSNLLLKSDTVQVY